MGSLRVTARLTDPLSELLAVARGDRPYLLLAVGFATLTHLTLGWLVAHQLRHAPTQPPALTNELFDIELPPQAEAAPPPPAEPGAPQAPAEPAPASPLKPRMTHVARANPAAEALAQAATVLTRQDAPDEPVDLTGFVSGSASTYAGGTTAASGTSKSPGHLALHTTAGPAKAASEGGGGGADRSQPAGVIGELDWHCPFPPEADTDRIDSAVATLRVDVDETGRVTHIEVLHDPAHGFGRAARSCAAQKSWRPAQSHEGHPVPGSVTVRVRFVR